MVDGSQDRGDGSGVACEGDISAVVVGEDIVEKLGETSLLRGTGFAEVGSPQGVGLCEIGLERIGGEICMDESFTAATIAGMNSDRFS